MLKYFSIILFLFSITSGNHKIDKRNSFLGNWKIDVNKTLFENNIPIKLFKSIHNETADYRIAFFRGGKYQENFLDNIKEGTWTRYNESLAIARTDSDEKNKLRKKILNRKISNPEITRNKKTRLMQKRYYLNRSSIRSFTFDSGNIIYHLNRNGKDIKVFFSKSSR